MSDVSLRRWRGLAALVIDAVAHGSMAIERIQKETAKRPFAVLEAIPEIAGPAQVVHVAHDVTVSGVHGAIRLVTRAVGAALDVAITIAAEAEADARPSANSANRAS